MIFALVHRALVHYASFTGFSFTVVHVILVLVHGALVHCASFTGFLVHRRSRDPCARSQERFCRSRFPCSRSPLSRSLSFTCDPRSRILVHSRSRRSLSFTILVHCRSLVHSRSRTLVHSVDALKGQETWQSIGACVRVSVCNP